jgi:integrase
MEGHVRKRHRLTCARRVDKRKRCNCDGAWQARIPDPARAGTTHKIERQFHSEREAKAWLVSQQAAEQVGGWIDPRQADRPFADVITAWQESWSNRLSPTTAARYRGICDVYLMPEFGAQPIGRITHERVQRFVNRLSADPKLAPGTVRGVYSVLRNAMNRGVRLGMVKVNPCTNVDLPRSPREEMLFLDAAEVRTLAEAIDPWYRVLIYTAAYCGLRAGELLAVQRKDVDLLRGVLQVRRSLREVNGYQSFGDTKTYTARSVSLPKFLVEMLREHLAQPLPGGNGPDALVFPSKTGKPLRWNNFYKRHFRTTVAGWTDAKGVEHPGALPARLRGLRFHDLRHTCASLSVAAGAHVKQISARLGHASVMITLDRYSHLYPSAEEAVAERLDAIFHATPAESNVVTLAR